jgi:hypothetical protein
MKIGNTYVIYGKFPDMKRAKMLGDGHLTRLRIHAIQFVIDSEDKREKTMQYFQELKEHHPEAEWSYRPWR